MSTKKFFFINKCISCYHQTDRMKVNCCYTLILYNLLNLFYYENMSQTVHIKRKKNQSKFAFYVISNKKCWINYRGIRTREK